MKNNKKADTIAGIIIAVFILSFAMLGIVNVLDYNQNITSNYEKETDLYILKSNSESIIKRLNIDHIQQDEKFWIRRNEATQRYEVVTGTGNEYLKYVDKDGRNIDPASNIGKTFIREFEKKIDILRYDIKPPEINNLVFHFDASNVDGTYNSTLTGGVVVNRWVNLAGNGVPDAVDKSTLPLAPYIYSSQLPRFNIDGLNGKPMVEFNGVDQMLAMDVNIKINTDRNIFINPSSNDPACSKPEHTFKEKSFAIVFKTSDDIINSQMVYEQGGQATGYNFIIEGGEVWAGIHNTAIYSICTGRTYPSWPTGHKFKSVSLGTVLPNTIYFVMVVQDSSNSIPSQNKLKIYLNGFLVNQTDYVYPQPEHLYGGLGNVYYLNVSGKTWGVFRDYIAGHKAYFKGGIGEIISRNHALSENEIRGVQNYFSQKWLGGKSSIRYDIVETTIKEFKDY
ncbi:hypothetical protein HUU51_02695 [Candidatus Gracilibacteria bacterium]|nr:hypothetical protein [Candidatus Gracilibacteria bacterium]